MAPGAQIYFYTAEGGQDSFAAGVNALVNAGVNVIVDDWSFSSEPFYQIAGPVDTAITNAIANGVSYFSSAGNYGNAYFESTWQPLTTQLVLQSGQPAQTVSAQQFDNGTTLQTITIPANISTSIGLQWNAAWPTAGASVPDELGMALYTMNGTLVATSHPVSGAPDYGLIPEIDLSVPVSAVSTEYQIAIYQIGSTPVSQFKYILFGSPGSGDAAESQTNGYSATTLAQDPGGTIDDPAAGQGSGSVHGHQLVPGVNTVGAVYWANTPAYDVPSDWTEFFSSAGPGQLLFNRSGIQLAEPISAGKVDFVAPDGIQTSVPDFQGFFGTSAAAPDAAAVAALMLQADPSLTPQQVTSMLEQSAATMDLPAADQGAGLVQAPGAVQLALNAAALSPLQGLTTEQQQVEAMYVAYFGRAGDPVGTDYWVGNLDNGQTIDEVAMNFANQVESRNLYPFLDSLTVDSDANRVAFIDAIYQNLFNRAPDAAGLVYWDNELQHDQQTLTGNALFQAVGGFILEVVRGAQNSSAGQDITSIQNKVTVASYFTDQLALNNINYANNLPAIVDNQAHSVVAATTSAPVTVTITEEVSIDGVYIPADLAVQQTGMSVPIVGTTAEASHSI